MVSVFHFSNRIAIFESSDNIEHFMKRFLEGKGNSKFIKEHASRQCCHLAKFSNIRNSFKNHRRSGGGKETPAGCEAAPGCGGKKDSLGFAGSPAHLFIKDLGEIHSRLLDPRPVIQGETRYLVKGFEEKRGLREMRALENLKRRIQETNEHTLPTYARQLKPSSPETASSY